MPEGFLFEKAPTLGVVLSSVAAAGAGAGAAVYLSVLLAQAQAHLAKPVFQGAALVKQRVPPEEGLRSGWKVWCQSLLVL